MVVIPEEHTGESVIAKIEAVGKALGLEDKAKALAADVSRDLEAAQKISANQNPRKRVLFIMSAQEGRIMASGTGTGANGIITLAGGVNAIDSYQGYKQLTDEAVEKAAPDLILTMNIGKDSVQKEDLLKNPALANSPAGRSGNIVQMDSLYLLGFGPRTGAASRELSEKLYGKQAATKTYACRASLLAGISRKPAIRTYRNDQPRPRGKTRGFAVRDQANDSHAGDRSARARLAIAILAVALCITALFSLTAGASDASVMSVLRELVLERKKVQTHSGVTI